MASIIWYTQKKPRKIPSAVSACQGRSDDRPTIASTTMPRWAKPFAYWPQYTAPRPSGMAPRIPATVGFGPELTGARYPAAGPPFFLNNTATTETYTLSLHDALRDA